MDCRTCRLVVIACALAACAGCGPHVKAWTATEVALVGEMNVCECVAIEPAGGAAYVSNMQTTGRAYWSDDGKGFISLLRPGGDPAAIRWRESTPEMPLNEPKGMCILGGVLYVADNTRVVGFPVFDDIFPKPLVGPKGVRLNDMVSDGRAAYVSDTGAGVVYRMAADGVSRIKAPPGVNGITFSRGRMFAVSWDLHEVYELDPTGKGDPVPFGLAGHFVALDGIEVLVDGTILVSDLPGNRVAAISPDRKTVRTLIAITTPADIGFDPDRNLLYVPQLEQNKVAVFKLEEK